MYNVLNSISPEWSIPENAIVTMDALSLLQEKLTSYESERDDIVNQADDEDRDLTEDEYDTIEDLTAKITDVERKIEIRNKIKANNIKSVGRKIKHSNVPVKDDKLEPTIKNNDGKHGFNTFGQFAHTLVNVARGDETAIQRMQNVASTYGSELNGPDGGFVVPPDFRTTIWNRVTGEQSLMSRCTQFTTSSNHMVFPKNEISPWDNTSGIRAYWEGEADAGTQTKPDLSSDIARLNKLMALVPVTDELLDDAPGMESYLRAFAPVKMMAKLNTAIVRGNGAGKPLGYLNSDSLVTVAKETSQDAGTVLFENVSKMWSRMYAPLRSNAVWIINQDIETQLDVMAFPQSTGTAVPLYMPAGGVSASPFATLKGRPVIAMEAASALGTAGDISLVDFSQYMILTKGQGIQTDVSMHLYFDQAVQAFRFIFRVTGQPLWAKTLTRENGSNSLSWCVTLADRT